MKLTLTWLGILYSLIVISQKDSLYHYYKQAPIKDSTHYKALFDYTFPYLFNNADTAQILINELAEEAEEQRLPYWQSSASNLQGILFAVQGKNTEAIKQFETCVAIQKKLNRPADLARAYNNIGNVYRNQGHYSKAIEYFQLSRVQVLDGVDPKMDAMLSNNVGILYKEMGQLEKAEKFYRESYAIQIALGNKKLAADVLNNLGTIFKQNEEIDSAVHYFNKAIRWYQEENHKKDEANSHLNLADIFIQLGEEKQARKAIDNTLKICRLVHDVSIESNVFASLGRLYLSLNKADSAIIACLKGYNLATENEINPFISSNCECLHRAYAKTGDYEKAYNYRNEHIEIVTYLQGEETAQEVAEKQFRFEIQKMELADSIQLAEQQKVFEATLKTKKAQQNMLSVAIGFLVLIALLIWRSFRLKKRDHITITRQKTIVEEKNREITDSINYAKRIQAAILPPLKFMKEHLPDSFIMYQPKDIVAGDFYWVESVGSKVLFAVADCTGHGVPGAMVSVICNNGLNRSVREHGLIDPGKILDKTREIVIQEFEKSEEEVSDGMDIALCSLEGMTLHYAGANNPLWVIRNDDLIERKANKQPIGKFLTPKPYTTHSINLQKGDIIYLFSDGFSDQFGGEKGKKLKPSNLRKLLMSINHEPMERQRQLLETEFENWRGNLEQIDDVCIIGVRV